MDDDDAWRSEIVLEDPTPRPPRRVRPLPKSVVKSHAADIARDPLFGIARTPESLEDASLDIASQEDEYKKGDRLSASPPLPMWRQDAPTSADTLHSEMATAPQPPIDELGGDVGLQKQASSSSSSASDLGLGMSTAAKSKAPFSSRFSWIRRPSYKVSSSLDDDDDKPSFASTVRDDSYISLDADALGSGRAQIEVDWLETSQDVDASESENAARARKSQAIIECLSRDPVDLDHLARLAWSGIPSAALRPPVWKFLLGYLPPQSAKRISTLAKKRHEYADAARTTFAKGTDALDQPIWHQISIDVPRTSPGIALWQTHTAQRALERILYIWAVRHPASGYVQGINDLATPFFQTFLSAYIDGDPQRFDPADLDPVVLAALEADTFWALSKLLDAVHDNYIFAQPGIQASVSRLRELTERVDAPLAAHLQQNHVLFIQFAFRWFNCLLMRELSTANIVRMWDTYIAEGTDSFAHFHVYVCLAFLMRWSAQLKQMDFQSIIIFLQSPPTKDWDAKQIELLVSEAFMWKSLFHEAKSHLADLPSELSDFD